MSDKPQTAVTAGETQPPIEQQAAPDKGTAPRDGSNPDAPAQAEPETEPVRLKSHFRGLPKDWEINRKKREEAEKEEKKS